MVCQVVGRVGGWLDLFVDLVGGFSNFFLSVILRFQVKWFHIKRSSELHIKEMLSFLTTVYDFL